ncbi:MAG: transcriptional repressor [Planctomycetota bacterium]
MPQDHPPPPPSDNVSAARPGRRQTKQQAALWQSLTAAKRPLSVDELLAISGQSLPQLSRSTVYRTIQRWLDDGRVAAVPVAGRGTFYEPQDVAAHHHHHFYCQSCERLYDLPGCAGGIQALLPPGFQLQSHEITLDGLCASCAEAV